MISIDSSGSPQELQLPSLDFKKEAAQLNSLIEAWTEEERKCRTRRELRENKKSTHEERQKKTILEDETIIPDRTINSGIRRSKVPYTNYITQSKRDLVVTNVEAPQLSLESLELWFTRGMRYPEWKVPWFELIDSMHVHGGAAIEVVYDTSKPLNVALEYVPREHLIFSQKTKKLQNCPRVLRCYEATTIQLEQFVEEYEFDQNISKDLFDKFHKQEDFIKVYRVLFKFHGIVFNAWYTKDNNKDWLRQPRPHEIGLFDFQPQALLQPVTLPVPPNVAIMPGQPPQPPQQVPLFLSPTWQSAREEFMKPLPLKAYPLFWFPFQVTENQYILETQGRVSLDLHVQEAMTHLLTNTVNASTRASNFYPSAEAEPGDDPQLRELGPVKHGVIMNRKLSVFQPAWPQPIILSVMQALKVGKADESGQTDFAATARKDANKTAKELELATEQAQTVITSDMDVFSSPTLSTFALCFNIDCHQALFLLAKRPVHPELLIGDYNLEPAGDIEVVKRQEDKQNAKDFFNIVQGTPAAEKILTFLIQRFFPDQADEWIAALQQPDKNAIIEQLVNVLKSVPQDELTPEQKQSLGSLIAAAQGVVGDNGNGNVSKPSGGPQTNPPRPVHAAQQAP